MITVTQTTAARYLVGRTILDVRFQTVEGNHGDVCHHLEQILLDDGTRLTVGVAELESEYGVDVQRHTAVERRPKALRKALGAPRTEHGWCARHPAVPALGLTARGLFMAGLAQGIAFVDEVPPPAVPKLTPRQKEVLGLMLKYPATWRGSLSWSHATPYARGAGKGGLRFQAIRRCLWALVRKGLVTWDSHVDVQLTERGRAVATMLNQRSTR